MESLGDAFPVVQAFEEEVIRAGFRPAQMVLVAFLITFGCARLYTYAARHGRGPGDLSVGGLRVHHMVPGIFLLLAAGFVAVVAEDDSLPWYLWWLLPTAFGVGAALVLDEVALWLNLRDVYWTEEGRRSIDAVIIAAALIAIVALGAPFGGQVIQGADPAGGLLIAVYHSPSVIAAVICLAKRGWITVYDDEKVAIARERFPEEPEAAIAAADPAPMAGVR